MAIRLKTKVALGGIFLFLLLALVAVSGFFYLNRVSGDARRIVRDNYETLNYSREMLRLSDKRSDSSWLPRFESNLLAQEKNITEPGEADVTVQLRHLFEQLKLQPNNDSIAIRVRGTLVKIMELNLAAIDKKNLGAQQTAANAKTVITIILTFCFLFGITFLYNFPSLIAGPVSKFTDAIRAIANRDYSKRIFLDRSDEFGELAAAFNSMAERLDEYEHSNLARILFEKQRAEAVINSLHDASIGIDSEGKILFANRQALQLLNMDEKQLAGEAVAVVKKKNDLFRFLVDDQDTVPFKVVLDEHENYFIKDLIELPAPTGGLLIVVKNITSFKELDVARTNFIATISHELKTPLASSDFSLKLLADERTGTLNDAQRELTSNLRADNQRMLRILSELMDMAQAESGRIKLDSTVVRAGELINKALTAVRTVALEKMVTIQHVVLDDATTLLTDAEKTSWVLTNLLTNAIKYSEAGGVVEMGVRLSGKMLVFFVTDHGPGIPPIYRERIFDRFFTVPGSKGGTGIGLSISREFIDAQHGRIWVESERGGGSTFCFELPAYQG